MYKGLGIKYLCQNLQFQNYVILEKKYKGHLVVVKVLEHGFEYNNKYFKTLSAVACAITGQHLSGYYFFGL